jgi:hypothetical protein
MGQGGSQVTWIMLLPDHSDRALAAASAERVSMMAERLAP